MKLRLLAVLLFAASSGLVSCNAAKEGDDLAKAQKCLDEVPQSNPGAASACLTYVEKYSSQQANILKCSIYMTAGGLIESKLIKGYAALKDTSITEANRTTAYMAILSLDVPDAAGGYTKAKAADLYCQATGVPGLKFISGVVLAGSWIAKTMAALPGGVEISTIIDNPASISTAVNNLLSTTGGCADPDAADIPPECTQDLADLGTAVATLSTSYCSNENADAKVCDDINAATTAAGNNATDIGQALLCYLKNKTYNSATGTCNP